MIYVSFQGKTFSITVLQIYAPMSNDEEADVECFYEDIQDFIELLILLSHFSRVRFTPPTPPQNVLFTIGDWNAKVNLALEYRMKQGKG